MKISIKNVYIWSGFQTQLDTVKKGKVIKVKGGVSTTTTYDKYNTLKYKAMSIDEVMGTIDDLISKQPNGEEGVLLTNGYANVFYTTCKDGVVRAVFCSWDADRGKWHLGCRELGDDFWHGGYQFFVSENSETLSSDTLSSLTLDRAKQIVKDAGFIIYKQY